VTQSSVTGQHALTESDVVRYLTDLSNWGRWGADDQIGTLNLITPQVSGDAAELVREGRAVSCSWSMGGTGQHTPGTGPQRFMIRSGEGLHDENRVLPAQPELAGRATTAVEFIGLRFHGFEITHLDALSHVFWDGQAYNGVPAARVSAEAGATTLDITTCPAIVTRGVLLDVAAAEGAGFLTPGTGVRPGQLEAAERRQGVRVRAGDAVLLRTGNGQRVRELGFPAVSSGPRSGWHASCLPWLRERDVAVIGNDGTNDVVPFEFPGIPLPVHTVGIVAMGLWLVDNCDLEELARTCAGLGRWEFMLTVAPLQLTGATGSPANPVAIF
jgi:kynurenine formamidase